MGHFNLEFQERNMLKLFVILVSLAITQAHDWYSGECPLFTPISEFSWDRFKAGRWYATEKFDTASKCLTYEFKDDPNGEYLVEQTSVLTGLRRLSVDNKVKYRGKLIARFPLSLLGTASFVIMDTDYSNYALICTCQSKSMLGLLNFHRRSCTILQRSPERDGEISRQLHNLLNEQIPTDDGDELPDHDFDIISHNGCDYEDNGKGLQLDVDKIIGNTQEEIDAVVRDVAGIINYTEERNNPEVEIINMPMREANPRL